MQNDYDYDMLVIGSGPAGQHAAIQAAKLEKKVSIVERREVVGGVCTNTGTIPSKTLREAILFLSGYRKHEIYGDSFMVKEHITAEDLLEYVNFVVKHEIEMVRRHLNRNGIDVVYGTARFADPHTVKIESSGDGANRTLRARFIVIAVGTQPRHDPKIPFDGRHVLDTDDVVTLDKLPRSLAILGGGVSGCEYACMFGTLGIDVTVVEHHSRLLPFLDAEIAEALQYNMRENNVTLLMGEKVEEVEVPGGSGSDENAGHERVRIRLASGKKLGAEKVLYAIGRKAMTDLLNLPAAGLEADDHGRLEADENYRTKNPHIYAAGDVIGFPSLASTSMEQGRVAACHAFGVETKSVPDHFPYGIYTIPEISYVGKNEEELTEAEVPYDVGRAHYREIARALIIGESHGLLKLIFDPQSRELLGIHIFGEDATDLIHIGQAVRAMGGTLDYFLDSVFNYPTLADGYKIAAFDGLQRLAEE